MDNHDDGEALFLIGERPRLQPAIKRGLAAGESGHIMRRCQRFRAGDCQAQFPLAALPASQGAARLNSSSISGTTSAGPDTADMNASKPSALMRSGDVAINTSSAARTAASRTKSVRERPRSRAARSMMAISASGNRIDNGCSLRWAAIGMFHVSLKVTARSVFCNTILSTISPPFLVRQTASSEFFNLFGACLLAKVMGRLSCGRATGYVAQKLRELCLTSP